MDILLCEVNALAQELRGKIDSVADKLQSATHAHAFGRKMEAENNALKAENKALKAENKALKGILEKVEAEVGIAIRPLCAGHINYEDEGERECYECNGTGTVIIKT